MRKRDYISPSAVKLFYTDPEAFYIRYLANTKIPNEPQTKAMSIGSAFDAYAKSYLHSALYGIDNEGQYSLVSLFETQVESHNRDWAWKHGQYVFECYKKSGALADLLVDLHGALEPPAFEFEVRGNVTSRHYNDNGMVLLGKPDVFFVNKDGHKFILDWKVNGYCSNSAKSPSPGYMRLRTCDGSMAHSGHHKLVYPVVHKGMTCSLSHTLDKTDEGWATQLATYGWLLGEDVGSDFLVAIDQIVAKPNGEYPILRVAEHRSIIDPIYQHKQFKKFQHCWDVINSNHIFRNLSLEDSIKKCEALESRAEFLANHVPDEVDELINFHKPAWKF